MIERDEQIIKHIGRFGLSIRAVIEELFFGGASSDNVLNRLIKERRIASHHSIPGGLCYYRLTLGEARARSVPEHRARPKRGAALRLALQVLWFCCMTGKARNRIERRKVGETFGNGPGSGKPHCVESGDDRSLVYRIYAPGPHSRDGYLLRSIQHDMEKGLEHPELRKWIEAKAFAFVVLVETPERKDRLKRLINKTGPYAARILVAVVPGLTTLAAAIRKNKEKNNADGE